MRSAPQVRDEECAAQAGKNTRCITACFSASCCGVVGLHMSPTLAIICCPGRYRATAVPERAASTTAGRRYALKTDDRCVWQEHRLHAGRGAPSKNMATPGRTNAAPRVRAIPTAWSPTGIADSKCWLKTKGFHSQPNPWTKAALIHSTCAAARQTTRHGGDQQTGRLPAAGTRVGCSLRHPRQRVCVRSRRAYVSSRCGSCPLEAKRCRT